LNETIETPRLIIDNIETIRGYFFKALEKLNNNETNLSVWVWFSDGCVFGICVIPQIEKPTMKTLDIEAMRKDLEMRFREKPIFQTYRRIEI